jgi:hypothetical protein
MPSLGLLRAEEMQLSYALEKAGCKSVTALQKRTEGSAPLELSEAPRPPLK